MADEIKLHYWILQPHWILHWHQNHKFWRGPTREHSWLVSFHSVQ